MTRVPPPYHNSHSFRHRIRRARVLYLVDNFFFFSSIFRCLSPDLLPFFNYIRVVQYFSFRLNFDFYATRAARARIFITLRSLVWSRVVELFSFSRENAFVNGRRVDPKPKFDHVFGRGRRRRIRHSRTTFGPHSRR